MSRKAVFNLVLVAVLIAAAAAAFSLVRYYWELPQRLSQHETIVLGQSRFVPGSQAALRVLVRDSKDGTPLEDAEIQVDLQPKEGGKAMPLFQGKTGVGGTAEVSFRVPADAGRDGTLVVKTRSSLGSDTVERDVTIEREYRVLLTTDKPIYQPGQLIHLRALALSTFDLLPAVSQPLEVTIADGKGNKVYRETLSTNEYGVAFTDFQLASEVNTGAYKITATLGNTTSEKTVTVEHYVLPKFEVDLSTDQTYYQPGQHVQGILQAKYFFGKPVSEGQVKIEGYTFDVQRSSVFILEGQTDSEGNYTFEFDLPAYLAGSEFEGGMARFYLEASVIDQAQHAETKGLSLPVAGSALMIEVVPEGGVFRPGVENILYVLTSYPDGSPAEAGLQIQLTNTGQTIQAETGAYGLAEVRYTPNSPYQYLIVQASDARGNFAQREFQFEGNWMEESVLLRPERPVYQVGDTMQLEILTSAASGTVYLDIVREGQTVSTRALEITNGKAEAAVDLTPDLYGTLELHAYKVLSTGSITRDTRLVAVSQAEDLQLSLAAEQETYRPGDNARINLQVNGTTGEGVQSAVGLAIVDEFVFALAESDPGFAKLYFLLEKEILQPRYDLHGYSVPEMMQGLPVPDPALEGAADLAAQASLSDAARQANLAGAIGFSLMANSHEDAMQRAYEQRNKFFESFGTVVFAAFLALSLALAGLSIATLIREKRLGRGLLVGWALLATLVVLFFILPLPEGYDYGPGFMNRMSSWFSWLESSGDAVVAGLLLAALAGFIILIGSAIRHRDVLLGWTVGLLPLFVIVLLLLVALNMQSSGILSEEWATLLLLVAFFLAPAGPDPASIWSAAGAALPGGTGRTAAGIVLRVWRPGAGILSLYGSWEHAGNGCGDAGWHDAPGHGRDGSHASGTGANGRGGRYGC